MGKEMKLWFDHNNLIRETYVNFEHIVPTIYKMSVVLHDET
jgi:hypothetical protein